MVNPRALSLATISTLFLLAALETSAGPAPGETLQDSDKTPTGRRRGSLAPPPNFALARALAKMPEEFPEELPACSEVEFLQTTVLSTPMLYESCANGSPPPLLEELACDNLPIGGLDHVAAGTGLRNTGGGTLRLRGAPPNAQAVAAWLYVGLLDDKVGKKLQLKLQDRPVDAELISTGDQPCWQGVGGQAVFYRAPVLSYLYPDINGDYRLEGVPSSLTDSSDPFVYGDKVPLAQGATLVVAYAHPRRPRGSLVYVFEAPFNAPKLTKRLEVFEFFNPPLPDWNGIKMTQVGGDGQLRDLGFGLQSFDTDIKAHDSFRLRGQGSQLDPNSDWPGCDGSPEQMLWDTRSSKIWPEQGKATLHAGVSEHRVIYQAQQDGSCEHEEPTSEFAEKMGGSLPAYDCVNVLAHIFSVCTAGPEGDAAVCE